MVVRNVVRSPVRAVVQSVFGEGESFHPFQLFRSGAQGAWYDPSNFSTLYQDAAGTTPVTAVEQPVRLMLDRSGRGNHATAPNDASRPVLRARYNLLTYSEQFDNGAWTKSSATITANAGVAPDGTTTADKIAESSTASVIKYIYTSGGISVAGGSFVGTVYAKAAERSRLVIGIWNGSNYQLCQFDLIAGSIVQEAAAGIASIQDAGNGWWRCQVTRTIGATTTYLSFGPFENSNIATLTGGFPSYTGVIGEGILLWGAQLLTAADQAATGGAYQRVGAATDYDTGPPWRPYLAFDGSDDSMSTSSIDFSGTDEMTVFAGVSKLSDAALGVIAETTADGVGNGSITLFAPRTAGAPSLAFRSKGTAEALANETTSYPAPITAVMTGLGDISADICILRVNGAQATTSATDQGTGNYGNYPLFIGRRGNTNLPFNGRLYSLAVLGRTATAQELTAMESWIAGKTGVSL